MKESSREDLIRVIKDEQEITKDYFINVAQAKGLINLDLNDFRKFADKYKLAVDARISVSAQIEIAMEEIRKHGITVVSAIILSVSFNSSYSLMMKELESVSDCLNNLTKQNVEVIWGIQKCVNILNQCSVSLFVFV